LDLASINKNLKKEKINLCDVLKDVEENIDLNLVDYQKQCEDFYVNADYNHLYILIKNLLSNAVKHNVKN
jgi:signal transduction histidine kinase